MALFGKGKSTDPQTLMKSGDFKGAIKLLQEKLKKNPNDLSTKLRLAEAFEGDGNKDSAAKLYIKEGEACIDSGQKAQGLVLLKKASKLNPADRDLAAKITSLESAPAQSAQSSFSFDMDTVEEPGNQEPTPAGSVEEIPAQEDSSAKAEIETPGDAPAEAVQEVTPAELPAEVDADVEIEQEIEFPAESPTPPVDVVTAGPDKAAEALPEAEVEPAVEEVAETAEKGDGTLLATPSEEAPSPELAPEIVPEITPGAEPEINVGRGEAPPDAQVVAVGQESAAQNEPPSRLMKADDPVALMQELFPGLSRSDAVSISSDLKKIELHAGQVLIKEGEEGQSLYLVMDGCLEASSRFENQNMRLGLLRRCDVIGEVAFLKEVKRTATVIAVEPSVVLELSRDTTKEHLQDEPELLNRLESILEERVERTIQTLKKRWKGG